MSYQGYGKVAKMLAWCAKEMSHFTSVSTGEKVVVTNDTSGGRNWAMKTGVEDCLVDEERDMEL